MTTTAISDISDLARILEEHPEWAETLRSLLLTKELLELPAQFAAFVQEMREFVRVTQEQNRRADERQARSEAEFAEFVRVTQEQNRRTDERLAHVEAEFVDFRQEMREFVQVTQEQNRRADERQARSEAEFAEFRQEMREFVQVTQEQNRRIQTQVGRLQGDRLEYRLHSRINPLLSRALNLRRPVILKSANAQLDESLYDQLDAAVAAGVITEAQSEQLREADFILQARRKDTGATVYLAVEVSRTIHEYDITRAYERAQTLAAATGAAGLPVVIGNFLPEPQSRQAQNLSVTVIQEDEPED